MGVCRSSRGRRTCSGTGDGSALSRRRPATDYDCQTCDGGCRTKDQNRPLPIFERQRTPIGAANDAFMVRKDDRATGLPAEEYRMTHRYKGESHRRNGS